MKKKIILVCLYYYANENGSFFLELECCMGTIEQIIQTSNVKIKPYQRIKINIAHFKHLDLT